MSTKPSRPALPPVLAPPPREAPARPTPLVWLCACCILLGCLGLPICAFNGIGLIATLIGPGQYNPASFAPGARLVLARQDEVRMVRQHFIPSTIFFEIGLLVKSVALIVAGIATYYQHDWGRRLLIWTFRLGIYYLLF